MNEGLDATDAVRLKEAIERLAASADRVGHSRISVAGNKVDLGSAGVWACVTCVIIMLVSNFYQNATIIDLQRKYDRMQDYLNAIYMQAPHLKPPDKA